MGLEVLFRLSIARAQALTWLTEAASKDRARPVLCGLQFEWTVNGDEALELTAVATNSYMLASRTLIFPKGTYEALPSEGKVLCDAKSFADALKSTVKVGKKYPLAEMQDTIVQLEEQAVMVASADGSEYKSIKVVDGEFPKWHQLVPANPVQKFDLAQFKEAADNRTATEKKSEHDFYFELPAVSPKYLLAATRIVGQPASQLDKGQPMRFNVAEIHNAHLKPLIFTVPNNKEDQGDLLILVMPVRI